MRDEHRSTFRWLLRKFSMSRGADSPKFQHDSKDLSSRPVVWSTSARRRRRRRVFITLLCCSSTPTKEPQLVSSSHTMVSRSNEENASSLTQISKSFEGLAARFLWTDFWTPFFLAQGYVGTIRYKQITEHPVGWSSSTTPLPRLTADPEQLCRYRLGVTPSRRLEIRSHNTSAALEPKWHHSCGPAHRSCSRWVMHQNKLRE